MKHHAEDPREQSGGPDNDNLHPAALLSVDSAVYASGAPSVNEKLEMRNEKLRYRFAMIDNGLRPNPLKGYYPLRIPF